MTTGHIMMAITLDGFIARNDHSLDWLMKHQASNEEHGFVKFQESADVIVMGSNTFKTVLSFGVDWVYIKPCIVLSRSMTTNDIPENLRDKVEISSLRPKELMVSLEEQGFKRAYVDGGAVICSFLKQGLIQDMKISVIPILLGEGIRIFGETEGDIYLELVSVTPFPSGTVDMVYKVKYTK